MVNYLYDMKDKLIAKGSAKQKIVLDNKIGLTTLDTVALTTNHKLITKFETITRKVNITIKVIAKVNEPLEVTFIKDNNEDIIGIGNYIYKHNKSYFKDTNKWNNYLNNIEYKINVKTNITSIGEIKK